MHYTLSSPWTWSLVLALTCAVGALDFFTGPELGLFVFYFAPVMLAGWRLGLPAALAVAVLSALVWFSADALGGNVYSHPAIGVWNTVVRLVAFVVVGWVTARVAMLLEEERQISAALANALAEVKVLQGLLPICAWCKQIRDEEGEWQQVETYIARHGGVEFTHGMCDACAARLLGEAGLTEEAS